jgi:hypothetical protein
VLATMAIAGIAAIVGGRGSVVGATRTID